jgi:hypothetical protein
MFCSSKSLVSQLPWIVYGIGIYIRQYQCIHGTFEVLDDSALILYGVILKK